MLGSRFSRKFYVNTCIVLILFYTVLRTAWFSDDAMITVKSVLNLLHGYGPVYNIGERVQAYTHPLWFFLISLFTFLTGHILFVLYALSFVLTFFFALYVLGRFSISAGNSLICGLLLISSQAYIDFATSGLENPLSNAIVLLLFALISKKESYYHSSKTAHINTKLINSAICFLCGISYLSRPDLILICIIPTIYTLYNAIKNKESIILPIVIGSLPIISWTAFSIIYYGYPFPNTAYAKLGAQISGKKYLHQGFNYVFDSLYKDPITLTSFFLAVFLAFRKRNTLHIIFAISGIVYCLYVIKVGGDFMSGRFFNTVFAIGVIIIAQTPLSLRAKQVIFFSCLLLSLFSLKRTVFSGNEYPHFALHRGGIANERGFYYENTGLLVHSKMNSTYLHINADFYNFPSWDHASIQAPRRVISLCGGLGFTAIHAGPSVYELDTCALADPFLSHLAAEYNSHWHFFHLHWRIGHLIRALPDGYEESVRNNDNEVADQKLKTFYDKVLIIVRGPIFSYERFKTIYDMNTGKYDDYLKEYNAYYSNENYMPN